MKALHSFFLVIFISLSSAAIAEEETKTFENFVAADTKTKACVEAKKEAQKWVESKEFVSVYKIKSYNQTYGQCDCSKKENKDWVCSIDVTIKR